MAERKGFCRNGSGPPLSRAMRSGSPLIHHDRQAVAGRGLGDLAIAAAERRVGHDQVDIAAAEGDARVDAPGHRRHAIPGLF